MKDNRLGDVEEEWVTFKEALLEKARVVCGVRKLGKGGERKGSEWWNERVEDAVRRKKDAYVRFLDGRRDERWKEYKCERRRVKLVVKEAKREADRKWSENLIVKFREKSKVFWREVNKERRNKIQLGEEMQNESGDFVRGEEVEKVWREYFESLLNVEEGEVEGEEEEENEDVLLENGNGELISKEEVCKALGKMKNGKSAGLNGVQVIMLKAGKESVIEWLERLLNVCWKSGRVSQDWQDACLVPIYKGKGDKRICGNYRGKSLLSVVGKVYGRIPDDRVKRITKDLVGEEQGGFREGRGCVDQVFTLRMLGEKRREKKKDLYVCFVDLEKAYDRVVRWRIWECLRARGIGGRLLEGVKAFYVKSRACVRIGRREGEKFEVRMGLRQGCVMSLWLFNLVIDEVVRGMNREGKGVKLVKR